MTSPYGETHRPQVRGVTHRSVGHETSNASHHQRGRKKITKHAVGRWRRGRNHQHIAGLTDLDRGMQHHVVAWMAEYRDGRTGDTNVLLNGPQLRTKVTTASDRLVHRRSANRPEYVDGRCRGSVYLAHHNMAAEIGFWAHCAISSRGKTLRALSSKMTCFVASSTSTPLTVALSM